jgi:hypothetical protein
VLSDGLLEEHELDELGAQKTDVDELVRVGLWHRYGHSCADCEPAPVGGIIIHDWSVYNPTKSEVAEKRAAEAERKRKWRDATRHKDVPAGHVRDETRDSDGIDDTPVPVPSPTPLTTDQGSSHPLKRDGSPQADGPTVDKPEVDLGKVKLAVQQHCGRLCSDANALRIVGTVMTRSKTRAKDKTAFIVKAISNDPFEWQKLIDEDAA